MEWTELKLPLPSVGETVLIDLGCQKLKLAKLTVDETVFEWNNGQEFIDIHKIKRWMRIKY